MYTQINAINEWIIGVTMSLKAYHAFTAWCHIFKVITLLCSNECNYYTKIYTMQLVHVETKWYNKPLRY